MSTYRVARRYDVFPSNEPNESVVPVFACFLYFRQDKLGLIKTDTSLGCALSTEHMAIQAKTKSCFTISKCTRHFYCHPDKYRNIIHSDTNNSFQFIRAHFIPLIICLLFICISEDIVKQFFLSKTVNNKEKKLTKRHLNPNLADLYWYVGWYTGLTGGFCNHISLCVLIG